MSDRSFPHSLADTRQPHRACPLIDKHKSGSPVRRFSGLGRGATLSRDVASCCAHLLGPCVMWRGQCTSAQLGDIGPCRHWTDVPGRDRPPTAAVRSATARGRPAHPCCWEPGTGHSSAIRNRRALSRAAVPNDLRCAGPAAQRVAVSASTEPTHGEGSRRPVHPHHDHI